MPTVGVVKHFEVCKSLGHSSGNAYSLYNETMKEPQNEVIRKMRLFKLGKRKLKKLMMQTKKLT